MLAQLLISLDAADGRLNNDFAVLDHGEMQTYRLHEVRKTKLNTSAGEFDTVEVARKDEKKNRIHNVLAGAEAGLPAGADAADRTRQGHHHAGADGNQIRYSFQVGWADPGLDPGQAQQS